MNRAFVCNTVALISFFLIQIGVSQEVNYQIAGSYLNNAPTTGLSAPGAQFLIEFTVPQKIAISGMIGGNFFFIIPILSGSFTFDGEKNVCSSGAFAYSVEGRRLTNIILHTALGQVALTNAATAFPLFFQADQDRSEVQFLPGSFGGGAGSVTVKTTSGQKTIVPAVYSSIVGAEVSQTLRP